MQTGEAAGFAAALSKKHETTPGKLDPDLLVRTLVTNKHFVTFFNELQAAADHPAMPAAQYFGTKGFSPSYNAELDQPLTESAATVWTRHFDVPQKRTKAVAKAEKSDSPSTGKTRSEALQAMFELMLRK